MRKPGKPSLTPDDWAKAAFAAVARGGIDAVAVEPIAVELGTTKGSFYWHFKNRDALIEAALDEWEQRLTDDVIKDLERESDPAQRLKKLLASAFAMRPMERAAEIALLANPDHPTVRRRVRHVAQRRIAYMAQQLEALGREPIDALDRAALLSYIYVGYLQTTHVAPNVISEEALRRRRLVELVFESIVAGDLSMESVTGAGRSSAKP
jgi:AcrR family transcriptional regulator